MHLKINGMSIPTHGKFEVDIYLDKVGEQLPEGAVIRIHDGDLKLLGRSGGPGLHIMIDQGIEISSRHEHPGLWITTNEGVPPKCNIGTIAAYFPNESLSGVTLRAKSEQD